MFQPHIKLIKNVSIRKLNTLGLLRYLNIIWYSQFFKTKMYDIPFVEFNILFNTKIIQYNIMWYVNDFS